MCLSFNLLLSFDFPTMWSFVDLFLCFFHLLFMSVLFFVVKFIPILFYLFIYLFNGSSEELGENGAGTCPTHRPQTSSPRAPSTWARRGVTLCRAQRITLCKKMATFLKLIATQWKQGANFWSMSGEFIYGHRVVLREQLYVVILS